METQNIFTFIKSSQAVPSFTVHQDTILQQEVSVSASVGPEKLITERDSSRGHCHWPVVSAPNVDTVLSRILQWIEKAATGVPGIKLGHLSTNIITDTCR